VKVGLKEFRGSFVGGEKRRKRDTTPSRWSRATLSKIERRGGGQRGKRGRPRGGEERKRNLTAKEIARSPIVEREGGERGEKEEMRGARKREGEEFGP